MARQARTSSRNYAINHSPAVECSRCKVLTRNFRPAVIDNKPVWVCKEDCT